MKTITIYGAGCAKCKQTEALIRRVIAENSLAAQVEKVEDFQQIVQAGVMLTPAVAVDGVMKSTGRIPASNEIITWLAG